MRVRYLAACLLAAAPVTAASTGPAGASPPRPDTSTMTAASTTIAATITLRTPHEPQLRAYAAAVSIPGTSRYRHYLTTGQLRERFGAPAAGATRVTAWARSAGLHPGPLDATGTRLPVTGTAAVMRRALGVTLYDTVQDGTRVRTSTEVRLPTHVAGDVAAITGLNEQPAQPMHLAAGAALAGRQGTCLSTGSLGSTAASCLTRPSSTQPDLTTRRPLIDAASSGSNTVNLDMGGRGLLALRPATAPAMCATSWAHPDTAPVRSRSALRVSTPVCGYTGPQLRALYGLTAADNGAGQTIVIVGAYHQPSTLSDANATFARNGVAVLAASRFKVKSYAAAGTQERGCDSAAWGQEQAVDVQTAHTLAPAATIVYAAAADCTRLSDTLAQVIADPDLRGSVISNSWGYPAEALSNDELTATDAILARAAVLGTGTYTASGMYGTATSTGMLLPDRAYPASSPWTTAVGGTTSAVGAGNTVLWQTGWASSGTALNISNTNSSTGPAIAAAGGGTSIREPRPAWQPATTTTRQVPDLAALADPNTGLLVGTSRNGRYSAGPVGGTGLSTPIVASLAALAQARSGHPAGLIAPRLWTQPPAATTLTDITHVDAAVPHARLGWDPVTGLGAPGRTFLTDVG